MKPLFVISCPIDTYSGYGARSRDYIKSVLELNKYEVQLIPQRWGETAWGFCEDFPEWKHLYDLVVPGGKLKQQPDIWTQITIPNEFTPIGKYNIGVTAGVESTVCAQDWIEGLNRMDMNWVSSVHAKTVFESSRFDKIDKRTNKSTGQSIVLNKPIEVILEGANLDVYKPLKINELKTFDLSDIKESFCYLFVGHWMHGEHGHDRKNVGVLVQEFFNTFKNKKQKPALILKASAGTSSYISREEILDKIRNIKRTINSNDLPNVYLINGEFSDYEMNELYNNPKVKAMVTTTKGEGFGRPLLEFTATGKPIIASGWSGPVDFLQPDKSFLLPGKLAKVDKSAANKWLLESSEWFFPEEGVVGGVMKDMFKHYKKYLEGSKKQKYYCKKNFSFEKMQEKLEAIMDKNAPKKVEILDISNTIASAKVTAWWGIDYMLLSKRGDKWMIEQVIWEGPLDN